MAVFTTTIHLQEAEEKDYLQLEKELVRGSHLRKDHVSKNKTLTSGKAIYDWKGSWTLPEIASVIKTAASKTGRKYSFFIMKSKQPG